MVVGKSIKLAEGGEHTQEDPTQREIFCKSYQINPKSDCIYNFLIYLDPNGLPLGPMANQSENGKYNLIPG